MREKRATAEKKRVNYYPFGLKHKGYNNVVNGVEYNYKNFQGQELTKDLDLNVLEFKFRIHDPAIGRFWQVDPLAEDYVYNSTYAFAENKVIANFELEGLEAVSIHARTFAPFDKFGAGIWSGDGGNRRFSTNINLTSRTSGIINYDANAGVTGYQEGVSTSHASYGATAQSETSVSVTPTDSGFSFHTSGDNDALIPGIDWGGPTHDIDVKGSLSFTTAGGENGNTLMTISGMVNGDAFPSAELFVTQPDGGNGIFLGVSPATFGPSEGPFLGLMGNNSRHMMTVNPTTLVINGDNQIQGVMQNGGMISIDKYNSQFSNQNPVQIKQVNWDRIYEQIPRGVDKF